MRDLARQDQTIERVEIPRDEAIRLYQEMGERFKLELLEDIRDARVSFYRQDGFLDMCRGPHLPSTGRIKAIKLLSTSGAYWRGGEHQPQLQRVYGVTLPGAAPPVRAHDTGTLHCRPGDAARLSACLHA